VGDGDGEKTLEKDENITVEHFDLQFDVDPLYKRIKEKRGDNSLANLMVNRLNTNGNLDIVIESKTLPLEYRGVGQAKSEEMKRICEERLGSDPIKEVELSK